MLSWLATGIIFWLREPFSVEQIEFMTTEMSKRDSEVCALQTRMEMSQKQQQDQSHHINVLKEQLKAREHKVAMLATDVSVFVCFGDWIVARLIVLLVKVEDLRKRLKEKELLLEKKNKAVSALQQEKRHMDVQLTELRDHLDIKERKVSVLQRKVDNLEELLNDKESQLNGAKVRLESLCTEQTTSEGARNSLEEMLKEKDRHIERLKEQKSRLELEHEQEVQVLKKINNEVKAKSEATQRELDDKHTSLVELREELSTALGEKFK